MVVNVRSCDGQRRIRRLTCPHLVMRGAVGGERQIGQFVCPSSCEGLSPPPAAAAASAELRGMITCSISCHWKKLYTTRLASSQSIINFESNSHVRICKMHSIVAQWVHYEPVLCVDEAYEGDRIVKTGFSWETVIGKLTLFVPNALGCSMSATPPWQALDLLSLSWWKREVEEMIKRLRGSGLGDALWSGRV